jgi:cbb3-type cytochrome oxidase subunit 3
MFKDVLNHMDLSALTTAGLVLFFIVFVAVSFYAFTRTPTQATQWSRIPLEREADLKRERAEREEESL